MTNRASAHVRMWKERLFERVPNYGVRRVTQLVAMVRYELTLLLNNKTESLEIATGLFAVAFGVQIMRPAYDFNVGYYGHLVALAPRGVWAVAMTFAGIDQILAVLTATTWCRRALAALMTAVWAFIAAVCWMTAPNNIAPGIYSVIAFLCGWTYIRLGKKP
jgi:hypothetical protein